MPAMPVEGGLIPTTTEELSEATLFDDRANMSGPRSAAD